MKIGSVAVADPVQVCHGMRGLQTYNVGLGRSPQLGLGAEPLVGSLPLKLKV